MRDHPQLEDSPLPHSHASSQESPDIEILGVNQLLLELTSWADDGLFSSSLYLSADADQVWNQFRAL